MNLPRLLSVTGTLGRGSRSQFQLALDGARQVNLGCAVRSLHLSPRKTAGHNKWSKIKRKKAVTDLEKSKMRGKLLDQIRTAVACGGNDPTTNIKLSGLVAQARGSGVPKTSMDSALKSTGSAGGEVREAVLYEGRGPSGYLVLIETLTDNRNRTRPEIRRLLEKQGGILGEPGSSAFMFEHKAIIQLSLRASKQLYPDPLELAIEVGAEDISVQDDSCVYDKEGVIQLKCNPSEMNAVCSAVREKELEISSASLDYLPKSFVSLTQEQFQKAEKLIEILSERSDVVAVYSNHELSCD